MNKQSSILVSMTLLVSSVFASSAMAAETVTQKTYKAFSISSSGYQVTEVSKTKTAGDYNQSTKFSVEIQGRVISGNPSVEGIEHSHETVEYKDPEDQTTRTRPGNNKTTRIKITREWSGDKTFGDLAKESNEGSSDRRAITVTILADDGTEKLEVDAVNCFTESYQAPPAKSRNSAHAIEVLSLVCEDLNVVNSGLDAASSSK